MSSFFLVFFWDGGGSGGGVGLTYYIDCLMNSPTSRQKMENSEIWVCGQVAKGIHEKLAAETWWPGLKDERLEIAIDIGETRMTDNK